MYRPKGETDHRGPGDCKHIVRMDHTQKRMGERCLEDSPLYVPACGV